MFVDSEILMTDSPSVAIWKNRIGGWKPPHDKEPITEAKRCEIIKNITEALNWRNIQVQIL